jgi:hypothetical protein
VSAEKVSRSQRARYERQREEKAQLRNELHRFALWLSPTWDEENEDDVAAALDAVDAFLEAERCDPPASGLELDEVRFP